MGRIDEHPTVIKVRSAGKDPSGLKHVGSCSERALPVLRR